MLSLSVSSLDGLRTSKNKMHPQNKMLGSDPFYFHFILKGASAPSFYLGTPDGGENWLTYLAWCFSNMLVYWRVPQQRMPAPPSLSSAGISPAVVSSLGMDGHGIGKGSAASSEWVERINGPAPKRIWSKDKSRDSFYLDHIIIMHLHIAIRNHTHVRYLFVCLAKSKMLSIFANMYIKGGASEFEWISHKHAGVALNCGLSCESR